MDYIIFDLEFNQFHEEDSGRNKLEEKCPFEIIQIGAIKLDDNLNEIAEFNALIKPQIYEKLHPFVEKLTNLSADELALAPTFDIVIHDFISFIGDKRNILVVWGMSDLQVLVRNITYYKQDTNQLPKGYINIQKYTSRHLMTPRGTNIGLKNAVELLGIDMDYPFHNAFYDAFYTTRVLKKIYSKNIKPNIYNHIHHTNRKKQDNRKMILDKKRLIKQFEKLYNKQLSKKEVDMIELAYKMGATHQFLIPQKLRDTNVIHDIKKT